MNPTHSPLAQWHDLVKNRNPQGLSTLLAEDAVFYSPVIGAPQRGKAVTTMYLSAALNVFVNDTFHYAQAVVGEFDAVLEFECVIDGVRINGVDMIRWNAAQQITEFKVMVRPLKALLLIQTSMMAMLAQQAEN